MMMMIDYYYTYEESLCFDTRVSAGLTSLIAAGGSCEWGDICCIGRLNEQTARDGGCLSGGGGAQLVDALLPL